MLSFLCVLTTQSKSEYFNNLLGEDKHTYESKVISAGLDSDPYSITDSEWSETPMKISDIHWSGFVTYMVDTPSPYTKKETK